jgi:hypothetical protein
MVKRLQQFWEISEGEDRKLLAHSLFEEIIYDLDTRRIVDFKIKSWAEPFLILRAALYNDQMGEEMQNRFNSGSYSSKVSFVSSNGTRTLTTIIGRSYSLVFLSCRVLAQRKPTQPKRYDPTALLRWRGYVRTRSLVWYLPTAGLSDCAFQI